MALNLIRNSRVFFTTNVDSNGLVKDTGFLATNTFEIQVQDGFSFSQNSAQETVTLNEAGISPIRGQRSFNTSLEPADWSFSTYIRPRFVEGTGTVTLGVLDADDTVACEESVLWGAISSSDGAGWVTSTSATPFADSRASYATFSGSNKHQLQPFGLVIKFDNSAYIIDNCVLDTATIDFGIDAIASIAWAGKGMAVREATVTLDATVGSATFRVGSATAGVYQPKNTTAPYIANKLSTMTLLNSANATTYTVALTGGSLSIANNVTYLTPANLGTLNVPCTYFTGTRTITSNVTAYLKTGAGSPSALLSALLTANSTENKFSALISVGGSGNTNKVELVMPTTMLTIPTITTEQVISTAITLTAQGSVTGAAGGTYDIEQPNELTVKYYATPNTAP